MDTDNEVKQMKERCKKRMREWLVLLFSCNILITTQVVNRITRFAKVSEHYAAMLEGFQYGLIIGLMLISVFFTVYYLCGTRNDEAARKICVKEDDERRKAIKEKAGVRFYLISVISFTIAAVVAGYFNHIVFFSLIGAVHFQILTMLCLKIYWTKKL